MGMDKQKERGVGIPRSFESRSTSLVVRRDDSTPRYGGKIEIVIKREGRIQVLHDGSQVGGSLPQHVSLSSVYRRAQFHDEFSSRANSALGLANP